MYRRSNGARQLGSLIAVAFVTLAVLPAASCAATSKGPVARLTKQVKALKKTTSLLAGQVTALQAKLSAVEGKVPSSPMTGPAGGDLSGSFPSPQIRSDSIISSDIADGSVGGFDLAPNSIFSSNILDGSVGADDITNGSIRKVDLAGESVGAAQLGKVIVREGFHNLVTPGAARGSSATCEPGEIMLSGGGNWDSQAETLSLTTSGPSQELSNTWEAGGRNNSPFSAEFFATVLCLRL